MVNGIIVAILVVVMFIALRSSVKHFAGQGGCCGGGSTVKPKKKKVSGAIVCRMSATVEGMHCVNCSNKIEGKIYDLDGVACRVNLKKKEAVIGIFAALITGIGDFLLGFAEETSGTNLATSIMSSAPNLPDWQLITGGRLGMVGIFFEGLALFAMYLLIVDTAPKGDVSSVKFFNTPCLELSKTKAHAVPIYPQL